MSRRTAVAVAGWTAGWAAGWALGWRLPALASGPAPAPDPVAAGRLDDGAERRPTDVAVVVPARDEAHNLGPLLESLRDQEPGPSDVVVVDDGSTDDTAAVAARHGVRVIAAEPPPPGWTGKTWACATGVAATDAATLVLLDADVRLAPGAVAALVEEHRRTGGLLSVLPEHRPEHVYEQLSAPFNLVSVMGSGAAVPGSDGRTALAFGPCLVIARTDLDAVGGFASVAGAVVEDLALAARVHAAGRPVHARAGGELVWFRMYPDGVGGLLEGWTKNMASGAASLPPARALAIGLWVTSAMAPVAALTARRARTRLPVVAAAASALQLVVLSRRLGRFPRWTGLTQPVAMVVFSAVSARSLWHRVARGRTTWKGREVALRSVGPDGR